MPKDHRSASALAAAGRLYKRKPAASTDDFRKVCERADKAIKKLTNREFNASYVLPFRRSAAAKRGRSSVQRQQTRRSVKSSPNVSVMKAHLTASTGIRDFLLDLGIADEAAHAEATKVAGKIVADVLSISGAA